jgi:hypothetical protein
MSSAGRNRQGVLLSVSWENSSPNQERSRGERVQMGRQEDNNLCLSQARESATIETQRTWMIKAGK